jgi:uncharacterized protein
MGHAYDEEITRWRAARLARLRRPDGWLSLTGLGWLHQGDNPVGSDPSSDVVLPRDEAPVRAGSIRLDGERARFDAEPGAAVTHHGTPVDSIPLADDATGAPTVLEIGALSLFVIRREGQLGVRIRDSESAALRSFAGIDTYPIDARWRIETRFEAYEPPRTAQVPTVLGNTETYLVPGALAFEVDGETYRLDAFLEDEESDLFIVFGDRTNGGETFGGGRFMYTKPADERGVVVLDFNKAYNPPCVFTPYATCPLPAPQNRLPIRIEAGEKRYALEVALPDGGHDPP